MCISSKLFVAILSILTVIEKSSGERREIKLKHELAAPLALIKNKDNSLNAAIPEKYNPDENSMSYFYNDFDEVFQTACPARAKEEWKLERKWYKNRDVLSIVASILFSKSSDEMKLYCGIIPTPTIKKTNEQCNHSGDEFYQVGYPVKTNENMSLQDISFITTYKICYSKTRGTLYSIHRIDSPNVLLLRVRDFYSRYREYHSKMDKDFKKKVKKEFGKNYFLYDLVGIEDMPNEHFRHSTSFLFNYVPIPKDYEILRGMIKIDNFVRLLSKTTKKNLTLYSGTYEHEKTVTKTATMCWMKKNCNIQVPVKSIWRIIMDNEQNSIITVTQYTQETCDKTTLVCPKSFEMLKEYKNGGCSYTCPVNSQIIKLLGLPSTFTHSGYLELGFPATLSQPSEGKPQNEEEISIIDAPHTPKKDINVMDFLEYTSFMNAVMNVDSALGQTIQDDMIKVQTEYGNGEAGNEWSNLDTRYDIAWTQYPDSGIDTGLDLIT